MKSLLRVDGLKRPYSRKREEVKKTNKSARDAENVALYSCTVNELETKATVMAQASKIEQLEKDLEAFKQKARDAETDLKKAQEELGKAKAELDSLKGISQENTDLKAKVKDLEEAAAQAQLNFKATLEAEQEGLVAEREADNNARMKIAWNTLYPNKEYAVWALAHKYAEEVIFLREKGKPEPESFEAWANAGLSEPGHPVRSQAHEIPSNKEDEGGNDLVDLSTAQQ
ncbi:tropomyosin-like [Chenopodium quinoa]|uniref:tropomyosin-like n=1 Tax=Chenopodium quinoa TaxID=63459 RepID=UPI000B791480|nr:tropomyosin-like [Chenopodium quinoa]